MEVVQKLKFPNNFNILKPVKNYYMADTAPGALAAQLPAAYKQPPCIIIKKKFNLITIYEPTVKFLFRGFLIITIIRHLMIHISVICEEEQDLHNIRDLLLTQEDFNIASMGKNGYDAIKSADNFHPDVIIMDIWMDGINGTDITPIIFRKSPSTKLITISSRNDVGWIKRAFRAGISGFLLKQYDMDLLVNAVRTVAFGGYYLSKAIKSLAHHYLTVFDSRLMADPESAVPAQGIAVLPKISNNERKIVAYIAKGLSDKEIAKKLNITPGTVRNNLAALKRKTGPKNRAQLVVYSLVNGLIDIPLKANDSRQRYI